MIARLGRVIYWVCCIIAGLIAAYTVAVTVATLIWSDLAICIGERPCGRDAATFWIGLAGVVAAAILWGIGRAIRYVLAGE
jgi:hypothetical protein